MRIASSFILAFVVLFFAGAAEAQTKNAPLLLAVDVNGIAQVLEDEFRIGNCDIRYRTDQEVVLRCEEIPRGALGVKRALSCKPGVQGILWYRGFQYMDTDTQLNRLEKKCEELTTAEPALPPWQSG